MKSVLFKGDERVGELYAIHKSTTKAAIYFQIKENLDHIQEDFWKVVSEKEWKDDNYHIDYFL